MILNKTAQTFSVEQHLCRGRFGWSPCSTLDVCSEAPQQKLLTQRSKNIGRNKERLSSQHPRPESGKQLANPDVKSKLFQIPKHSYVTTSMDRWAPITAPHPCQICLWFYTERPLYSVSAVDSRRGGGEKITRKQEGEVWERQREIIGRLDKLAGHLGISSNSSWHSGLCMSLIGASGWQAVRMSARESSDFSGFHGSLIIIYPCSL